MRVFRRDDLDEVNAWHACHGMPTLLPAAIPNLGFITPGVAAGFLYETDSNICLIEGFVSRPGCGPKARHHALNEITDALLSTATERCFEHAIAICRNSAIEKRAARHGFRPLGRYAVYGKEL